MGDIKADIYDVDFIGGFSVERHVRKSHQLNHYEREGTILCISWKDIIIVFLVTLNIHGCDYLECCEFRLEFFVWVTLTDPNASCTH